jgi:prolyl-tRNA synthetase
MNTYCNSFVHTIKEAPKDAELVSHQLMIRSGMIRKVASGVYSILPLGQRVFDKLRNIIRQEMAVIGAVECDLPHLIPSELWKKSGRWTQYGKELLRMTDRHDRDFCFGPTHEEVITDLVSFYIQSYKQLPVFLYQIQTKFRDEIRPRFGLMRGREFLMKDAYSFHPNEESLNKCYEQSIQAYRAIFNRCGLRFIEASADSGAIGGNESVEFLVVADSGEDTVLVCSAASYAANVEAAPCVESIVEDFNYGEQPFPEKIHTPNVRTINDVVSFFSHLPVTAAQTIKSILIISDNVPCMFCLAGNKTLNETKVTKLLGKKFRFATDDEILNIIGAISGYIGPLNTSLPVYLDYSLQAPTLYVCGANENHAHFASVIPHRDIPQGEWVDIRNAESGDPCPADPSQPLVAQKGIEVGHVFKLGTKYSESMKALFSDSNGQLQPFQMGCYGIGVGRTIAAAIEQSHDAHGIVWPKALAPYDVVILNLSPGNTAIDGAIAIAVQQLEAIHLAVIVDDRSESVGVKFKDADLIGIPIQLIFGKTFVNQQKIEVKYRSTGVKVQISTHELISYIGEH